MTPLALLLRIGATDDDALPALLEDLRAALRPVDTAVFVAAPGAGSGPGPARRIRGFMAMEGFGGARVAVVAPGIAPTPGEAFEIGLATLRERPSRRPAPAVLLCLPGTARIPPGALDPLRRRMGQPDAPGLLAMRPEDGAPEATAEPEMPLLAERAAIRFDLLANPARPRADGPGGEPALLHHLAGRDRTGWLRVDPALLPAPPPAGPALARALAVLAADPAARSRLDRQLPALVATATPGGRAAMAPILAAAGLAAPAAPAAPPVTGRALLPVWRGGDHAHRTPLAYPALAPLWQDRLRLVDDPAAARLLVLAHPLDLLRLPPGAAHAAAAGTPAALLSEEPFWDSLYSPDPLAAEVVLQAAHLGEIRLRQINHHTSAIFDFDRIPYFLLTDHGYLSAYAARFARNARRSAADWRDDHAARPRDLVFMAERRTEAFHDVAFPEGDVLGLCAWRTRLALACDGPGTDRLGASWGTGPSRFAMPHWHLDKLMRLDGQARLLSGLENTHQPTYLSEKLFDAFACGSRPLYMASPAHRLRRLGLPEAAWIDLWGLDAAAAADRVAAALAADADTDWQAFVAAQGSLARLFGEPRLAVAERARVGAALTAELIEAAGG